MSHFRKRRHAKNRQFGINHTELGFFRKYDIRLAPSLSLQTHRILSFLGSFDCRRFGGEFRFGCRLFFSFLAGLIRFALGNQFFSLRGSNRRVIYIEVPCINHFVGARKTIPTCNTSVYRGCR